MSEALEEFAPPTDLDLDTGIRYAVLVLRSGGIETFESCQGGLGHSYVKRQKKRLGIAPAKKEAAN